MSYLRCLKKYCECFKLGRYCGKNCTCISCKNKDPAEQRPSSPDFTLVELSQIEKNLPFMQDTGMQITDGELIDIISTDGREMELSLDKCDVHAIMESIAFSHLVSRDTIEREMQKVVALVEQKSVRSRNSTAKRKRDWMQNDIITPAPLPCNSTRRCDATPEKRSKISDGHLLAHGNHDLAYLCDEHGAKLHQISSRKSCVVGSDPNIASVYVKLPGVAPAHATIMRDGQKWLIRGMLCFMWVIVSETCYQCAILYLILYSPQTILLVQNRLCVQKRLRACFSMTPGYRRGNPCPCYKGIQRSCSFYH